MTEVHFTGKPPLADEVVAAMAVKPGILGRKAAVARVIAGIDGILEGVRGGCG